jgi:hypothetical protein
MKPSHQYCLSETFNAGAETPKHREPAKGTPPLSTPLSIRVTAEEKAQLQKMAGKLALSAYIRERLFGDTATMRAKRYQEKPRQPKINHVEIARLLGMFGQSELARSILALSLAVQAGELEASPEVEQQIGRACDDIYEIKNTLITALNVKMYHPHRIGLIEAMACVF